MDWPQNDIIGPVQLMGAVIGVLSADPPKWRYRWNRIKPSSIYDLIVSWLQYYPSNLQAYQLMRTLLGHAPSFLGEFSHDTIVVAPFLSFLNMLKSCCLVFFSWRKMQKTKKKHGTFRNLLPHISTTTPL